MKYLVLLLLLTASVAKAQIPDYFANDPKWQCGTWTSNQWVPPYIPESTDFVYYLDGDTMILGNTYHIVHRRGYKDISSTQAEIDETFDEHTGHYLRQEGRSIRFYTYQNGVDSLLASYDYSVGDTIAGDVFQGCGYNNDTIQKVDSVLVGSEYRRVYYLDSLNGPVITEGIGHQVYINATVGEFMFMMCGGIGFDTYLKCYGHGEISEWDYQGQGGQCDLSVGINESKSFKIQLVKNPVSNEIRVQNLLNEADELRLYDLHGKQVAWAIGHNSINVADLANGTYLLKYISADNPTGQAKVIIQH